MFNLLLIPFWRLRGGLADKLARKWLKRDPDDPDQKVFGTQTTRILFWGIPFTLAVGYTLGWTWWLPLLVLASWVGLACAKYSKHWNLESLNDWIAMFIAGIIIWIPVQAFVTWQYGFYPLVAFLLFPICYWLGKKLPALPKVGINGFTEWAEWIFGALVAINLMLI